MKKLVIAAAIAAMSSAATAQSVSIYGILDSSVHAIDKATATTNTTTAFVDGALVSSRLGFRGSEDLGNKMKAIFQLETDVQTNNGGTNQNGIFRRASWFGLETSFGEITLGTRLNPLIATNASLMPLGGNSFETSVASALGYADFYTKNAVTYTTPLIGGLRAQVQHGLANTAGLGDDGTVTAGSIRWDIGNLALMAAGQDRNKGGTTSSANATSTAAQGDVKTYMAGAQYKILPQLTAAVAYVNNNLAGVEKTNMQYGVRYDLNSTTSLGVNRMNSETEKNSLTNVQARYAMSKRTTLYTQYTIADNDANSALKAVYTNTGTSPAVNVSGLTGVANATQKALGVGIIHSF